MTKLGDSGNENHEGQPPASAPKNRDFGFQTVENTNVKRISSARNINEVLEESDEEPQWNAEGHSVGSSCSTEIFQFDVYEREGFDQIMRTVAGSPDENDTFARSVCDYLEIFESLTPGRCVILFCIRTASYV